MSNTDAEQELKVSRGMITQLKLIGANESRELSLRIRMRSCSRGSGSIITMKRKFTRRGV
jgi:hypothetical protein